MHRIWSVWLYHSPGVLSRDLWVLSQLFGLPLLRAKKDPNQYLLPWGAQISWTPPCCPTPTFFFLLDMNQHPLSPENTEKKKTAHTPHKFGVDVEPWPLTFGPWPFCLMAYRLRLASPGQHLPRNYFMSCVRTQRQFFHLNYVIETK